MNHLETMGSPVSEKIKTMIKFENQLSTDNLSVKSTQTLVANVPELS